VATFRAREIDLCPGTGLSKSYRRKGPDNYLLKWFHHSPLLYIFIFFLKEKKKIKKEKKENKKGVKPKPFILLSISSRKNSLVIILWLKLKKTEIQICPYL